MSLLDQIFVILNVLVSALYLWQASRSYNANGRRELGAPSAWVYIWQLLGVGLVIYFRWSPWHLIWWFFPVGWIVAFMVGKIAIRLGYDPFGVSPDSNVVRD